MHEAGFNTQSLNFWIWVITFGFQFSVHLHFCWRWGRIFHRSHGPYFSFLILPSVVFGGEDFFPFLSFSFDALEWLVRRGLRSSEPWGCLASVLLRIVTSRTLCDAI